MIYEYRFIVALLITITIEAFVLFAFLYKKEQFINILYASVIASSLTLPYLWFVLPAFIGDNFLYILVGEFLVFVIESFFYKIFLKISTKKAFLISLVANASSFLFGLIVFS